MVIKRVSFIEAGSPCLHFFSKFPIPRHGALLLSTILREKGYEVKAFIEDVAEPDWSFIESSDFVCISTITSTAIKAYGRTRGTLVQMQLKYRKWAGYFLEKGVPRKARHHQIERHRT